MSIWPLTFQCRINLVFVVISWMKIVNIENKQNKKLVSIDVAMNHSFFFFWPFVKLAISVDNIS